MSDEDSELSVTVGTGARKPRRKRKRGSRRFRRLDERASNTAPAPVAWIAGAVLGAAGGAVFHAWETLVLHACGVPTPDAAARTLAIGASASVGAAIGAWAAAPGLYGPRWATTATVTMVGWLLSAKVGRVFGDVGIPAMVGVLFGLAAGIAAGQLVGRLPGPAWAHQGLAGALLVGAAIATPLHVSVLAGATTTGALLATALVVVMALALAGGSAGLADEGRAPILPLAGALALALVLHAVLGLRTLPGAHAADAAAADTSPMVIVVVSGLRADKVLPTSRRLKTPNLDRFARTALVYERAYATSNWSVPSLGSLLTGLWPYAHGAGVNNGARTTLAPLRPDVPTLARRLRAAGGQAYASVAWPSLRTYALDAGFDAWQDDPGSGAMPAALLPLAVAGVDPAGWPRTVTADVVTDRAVARIASLPQAGWLLFVQYGDAGGPLTPTPEDEGAVGFTTRPWPTDRYDAALHRVDRAFGALIDAIPADAWVVVVGDRGTDLGESRAEAAGGRDRATYGHTMFDELVHVPLMVRVPGRDGARVAPRRVPDLVSVADVAPTLLAAAGLDRARDPRPLDGEPLNAALGAEAPPRDADAEPRFVLAQSSLRGREQQMVIEGWYKLLVYGDDRSPVYDLQEDPLEGSPLRSAGAANDTRLRHLRALLPPPGGGASMVPQPSAALQLGQVATRVLTGGNR